MDAPAPTSELRTFFGEFRRNFHTTGAIVPSSRWLARALARHVAVAPAPRRILEVGPGTGAVTRHIASLLGPDDRLDVVELNETFVASLTERLRHDPPLRAVADRVRVIHAPVQELPAEPTYHAIVSGLPLNNFSGGLVADILEALADLAAPSGTLSFFEYVAVRPARSLVSRPAERRRLRDVGCAIRDLLSGREFQRELVLANVPPAWVHHVRFEGPECDPPFGGAARQIGELP